MKSKTNKTGPTNKQLLLSIEFFETLLHNLFGSFFNYMKLKIKRSKHFDINFIKYIIYMEQIREFYEDVVVSFFNLYCFFKRIDFGNEGVNTFFKKVRERNYVKPLVWFIKSPYRTFAVTIRNYLQKLLYD